MMQVRAAPNVEVRPFDGEGTGTQCFRYQEYTAEPMSFRIEAHERYHGASVYRAFVNGERFAAIFSTNDPYLHVANESYMHSCCSFIEDIQPFPMAYIDEKTSAGKANELRGFQRWVIRRADLTMTWAEYMGANYRPEKVRREVYFPILEALA